MSLEIRRCKFESRAYLIFDFFIIFYMYIFVHFFCSLVRFNVVVFFSILSII